MKNKKLLKLLGVGCIAVFAAISLFVSLATAEVTENFILPFSRTVEAPFVGEVVQLTGYGHFLTITQMDANGGMNVKIHHQLQGTSGVGLTTGKKYQASGKESFKFRIPPGAAEPYVFTCVSTARVIGQGPGNNMMLHYLMHVTINANGTVTADIEKMKAAFCK